MMNTVSRCAIAVSFLLLPGSALAETEVLLLAERDASVSEHQPDEPQAETFRHVLSAGVGRGLTTGRSLSYVRFDLGALPTSTLSESTVVDEANLSLMATSFGLARPEQRFLVTVSVCEATDWDETEVTWRTRPCAEDTVGETSIIVYGADLPHAYQWNVARGVARALSNGAAAVTFKVDAIPLLNCDRDPLEGKSCSIANEDRIGLVRFASRERAAFGVGVVPHLVVSYSREPK